MPGNVTVAADPMEGTPQHIVVSAGIASTTKATDVVAKAFRLLAIRRSDTAGVLVGPGGEAFIDGPEHPGVGEAVVGRVIATGAVSDADFDGWLASASLAVQLRVTSNGESSGVVAQTLARGLPTIVSDFGAMSELPDDAVVKVPADVTAESLAEMLSDLLDRPVERAALQNAALGFARRESYAAVAQRIVTAIS